MPRVRETLRIRTFFLLFLLLFFLPTPFYYKLQTKGYAVVAAALIHSTPFFLFSLSLLACFVCVFVYESMIPTYRYSVSSPMPIDLNEDHTHHLFSTNHQASCSSSSLSYSILFNPDQDQGGSCSDWKSKHLQSDEEVMHIIFFFVKVRYLGQRSQELISRISIIHPYMQIQQQEAALFIIMHIARV